MSLRAFQHALSELVMSRRFCAAVQSDPDAALAAYELDPRERGRLAAIARQPGVRIGAMIHRSFRLNAIAARLPLTCAALGRAGITHVIGGYLAEQPPGTLYYNRETARFGAYVLERAARGELAYPHLEDVLRLELALVELGDAPPLEPLAAPDLPADPGARAARLDRQHRVLRFSHDPQVLLPALRARQMPQQVPAGDYWLLLSCPGGQSVQMALLDPRLGALLARCDGATALAALCEQFDVSLDQALALAQSGVLRLD